MPISMIPARHVYGWIFTQSLNDLRGKHLTICSQSCACGVGAPQRTDSSVGPPRYPARGPQHERTPGQRCALFHPCRLRAPAPPQLGFLAVELRGVLTTKLLWGSGERPWKGGDLLPSRLEEHD